ncbi:MAG: DUF1844 domain-containing protein [Pirellulales bacterium]|nr:DUF1844 domain-containing protein [Pirellulales bacterium]
MTEPEEKKIIVDEDWKTQVEREKEEAAKQEPTEPAAEAGKLPPANLTTLATTLMTQALASLGQLPNPVSGKPEVDLDLAKHMIDTINVVYEKTEGNRTDEETKLYDSLLHQLRMAYVAAQSAPPPASS